jgi:integral membrane protein
VNPRPLFRLVARAEAVTWALLLSGMFLKYVTETTELGVRVFGMVHGVVFVAYCVAAVVVAVDRRWPPGRTVLALVAAVPPFATLAFERYAERRAALGAAEEPWRLRAEEPGSLLERLVAWLVRNPALGAGAGALTVAGLTAVALVVGPPVG